MQYVQPLSPVNRAAILYDLASSPARLAAISASVEAGDGNTTVGTVPITLVNTLPENARAGVILFKAVYVVWVVCTSIRARL